jgi:hypothetical protein
VGGFSRLNLRIPSPGEPVESVHVATEFQKKGEKIKVENEVGLSLKCEEFGAAQNLAKMRPFFTA